ncbi:hypothetical protein EVAR_73656_1 [Eumeta japonica]|uniref:Uncharacterized protein n=1 Tax=Eumeta variegata TaxID=151549 RepID=A0A4C1TQI0_EUMVA|nr:hypothetical protein EVAR_73656_1 [Eumeta japonica]
MKYISVVTSTFILLRGVTESGEDRLSPRPSFWWNTPPETKKSIRSRSATTRGGRDLIEATMLMSKQEVTTNEFWASGNNRLFMVQNTRAAEVRARRPLRPPAPPATPASSCRQFHYSTKKFTSS